jgi:hypothetical protein
MAALRNPVNTDTSRWDEVGYCAFPQLLSAGEADAMRARLDADTLDRPTYLGEPHTRSSGWMDVCRNPKLLDAIEACIGRDIVLVFSSFFIKPADGKDGEGNDANVAWHQDNNYWAAVHGTEGVITVWIAVDDNGAMQLLPATHTPYVDLESHSAPPGSIVSREVDVDAALEATAVTIAYPAGAVSIHDSYLIHGSGVNHSGRRRAAYTIRYLNARSGFCDMTRHPVPGYLVRGERGPLGGSYIDARPGTSPPCWTDEEYHDCGCSAKIWQAARQPLKVFFHRRGSTASHSHHSTPFPAAGLFHLPLPACVVCSLHADVDRPRPAGPAPTLGEIDAALASMATLGDGDCWRQEEDEEKLPEQAVLRRFGFASGGGGGGGGGGQDENRSLSSKL